MVNTDGYDICFDNAVAFLRVCKRESRSNICSGKSCA